ncbi:MAG: DVUA0089 family protein [Gammaproteobacteria bacterium]|nr:DVUA0089 family protein [Gammaproteobacteria bacterium]
MTIKFSTESMGDAPADASTGYDISADSIFDGRLDSRSDEDWVRVKLEAGLEYDIFLAGRGGAGAADTILEIYNASGELLAMNDDADRNAGTLSSYLRFQPGHSGVYYLGVSSYALNPNQENWGDYRLRLVLLDGHEHLEETGGAEPVIGTEGDDVLTGAQGPDWLIGSEGDDRLDGREGDDRLYGGEGADILIGGPGADLLSGGPIDEFFGTDTASYITSASGVVVRLHTALEQGARGGDAEGDSFVARNYTVTDDEGNTREVQVPDIEDLIGSEHADILAGDFRDNYLRGEGGNDKLYGGPRGGDDVLFGGPGNDQIYGGEGYDWLLGGPGDDLLKGGADNDHFDIELELIDEERSTDFEVHFKTERHDYGNDQMEGGPGADLFYFYPDGGDDTILDFGNGEDRIVLQAFEDIQSVDDLTLQQRGGNLLIDLAAQGGGTITLQDYNQADISEEHFIFFVPDDSGTAA